MSYGYVAWLLCGATGARVNVRGRFPQQWAQSEDKYTGCWESEIVSRIFNHFGKIRHFFQKTELNSHIAVLKIPNIEQSESEKAALGRLVSASLAGAGIIHRDR